MSRISFARCSLIGMHLVLFSLVIAATGGFLQWQWHATREFAWPIACCCVAAVALAWTGDSRARFVALPAMLVATIGAWLAGRLSVPAGAAPAQWIYVIFAGTALSLVFWRLRCPRGAGAFFPRWTEDLRLVSLPALAGWLFQPYLTSRFFGGVDARSYGYGMMDALHQARAGVFPVFVGQSEFMFEGVIHPIRTAPYHHYFGMLLDLLTWRALDPIAVQHLTVVMTAMLAALVCYLCLVRLAQDRRWLAWAMTVLYLGAPAVAGFIYGQEMYMTFMAFAWLPLVLFGNIRLISHDDGTGWKTLAAGLVLVWVCHAPVGLWLTLATGILQVLRLLLIATTLPAWRRAVGGAGLFAALSAYYFWSMREVASLGERTVRGPGADFLSFILLVAGFAVLLRYLTTARWQWLVLAAGAIATLWFTFRGYSLWLAATLLCAVIWVRIAAFKPAWGWRSRLPEISVALILVAGVLTLPWLPPARTVPPLTLLQGLFPRNLLPLTERANTLSDLQLGYSLLGAWLLGVTALFLTRLPEVRLPVLVGLVGLALLVPVPGLTRFLLTSVPEPVNAISSVSLWLRYLPILAVLCTFMGFLGAAEWMARYRWCRPLVAVLLGIAMIWSFREAKKFVGNGYRAIQSTGVQLDFHRPENTTEFAYIFSWMPVSPYQVNGVADYHLESRLLQISDPSVEAAETVPWPEIRWQHLTGVPDPNPGGESWLNFLPKLTLAPGEYRLLRFRFFDRPYNGVLIMRGSRGWYREYQMPNAGFGQKSFGVAPERPKTLAIWNSSAEPQSVDLVFYRPELPADSRAPVDFAEMAMISYDPEKLPIRTLGLIPYRAAVTLAAPAFLETPRAFIPGYRATVNGQSRPAVASPNHKVMVKLDPGENLVELRYTGTVALWLALTVSGLAWIWLIATTWRAQSIPVTSDAQARPSA